MLARLLIPPLATAAVLAGCGSVAAEPAGEGGSGGGATASSSGPTASSSSSSLVTATNQASGTTTTGSGSGACTERLFSNPDLDDLAAADCCSEVFACQDGEVECIVEGSTDEIDTSHPNGEALYSCIYHSGWYGPRVCDSGFVLEGDSADVLDFAYCLDVMCCAELFACTDGGADVDGCIACLHGDAEDDERCADASACSAANCDVAIVPVELCDSGLGGVGPDFDSRCIEKHCCVEIDACTNEGESPETIDACLACFQAGGGAECDATLACLAEHCNTEVCDSGFRVNSYELAECLTASCCDEWEACTSGGADVEACSDCLDSEDGGPLCDDAIACFELHCAE